MRHIQVATWSFSILICTSYMYHNLQEQVLADEIKHLRWHRSRRVSALIIWRDGTIEDMSE